MSFLDLRDDMIAAVDEVWAEPVRLSFMADGVVDATRPMVEIEAVLRVATAEAANVSGAAAMTWQSRAAAATSKLYVDRARHGGLIIRSGDRVRANARPGKPWFEVLFVDDRDIARLVLHLGET